MNAVPIEVTNGTTPVIQVSARSAAPRGHPELAPQVDDHEREEQLDAPQVHRVDEVAERRDVPPRRAAHGEHAPETSTTTSGREGQDAEDIDPRRDVDRLPVRERLPGWNAALRSCCEVGWSSSRGRWPGSSRRSGSSSTPPILIVIRPVAMAGRETARPTPG